MDSGFLYRRVLLKLTGEALKGRNPFGYDAQAVKKLVSDLAVVTNQGIELGLVIGAGNIWRGEIGKAIGMDPVKADYMGMLGTVMNALAIKDAFENMGIICEIQSSIDMRPIAEPFEKCKAVKFLEEGRVVIFACGTGHPFFTTDTAAALRALEIDAEVVLKATKVDGVYSDDPFRNPEAVRYDRVTFEEVLQKRLRVMDSTAFSLCQANNLPIIVFNFSDPENLSKVLCGETDVATVVSN